MESNVAKLTTTEKFYGWFQFYQKQAIWGTAAILIAGLVIYFVIWRKNEKETHAGVALSQVAASRLTSPGAPANLAEAYLKVANSYFGTRSAERALLLSAGALFDEGKFSEAQERFQRFTRQYRGSPYLNEAQLGVATSLEAQGKLEDATMAYKSLVDRRPADNVLLPAKAGLARVYERQHKPELAYPLYEEVVRADPYGSLGAEAGMRGAELKATLPNLGAAPAASVATAPATAPIPAPTNSPAPAHP